MDQLSRTARAYYNGGSRNDRESARTFFRSLDDNGDNRISLSEFLGFMKQEGYHKMNNFHFFGLLDRDGNGTLDFWEVMTLYYIIKSGRPFCDGCDEFLSAQFFACVECFGHASQGCCICIACYEKEIFVHRHKRPYFYDNFTLLEIKRRAPSANQFPQQASTSQAIQVFQQPDQTTSTSSAIVLANGDKMNKWSIALRAFENSLAIGGIVSNLCSIL